MTMCRDTVERWAWDKQVVDINTGFPGCEYRYALLESVGLYGVMVRLSMYSYYDDHWEEQTFIPWVRIETIQLSFPSSSPAP